MSITSITTVNPITGISTTTRFPTRTHEFWAITRNRRTGTWSIQRAGRMGQGTYYDKPLPEHTGFKTKKVAQDYKREHLS